MDKKWDQAYSLDTRYTGKHFFHGALMPGKQNRQMPFCTTFSVGIFQALPKAKNGLKKSAVIARVSGPSGKPASVYKLAAELCVRLDNGETLSKKNWRIG